MDKIIKNYKISDMTFSVSSKHDFDFGVADIFLCSNEISKPDAQFEITNQMPSDYGKKLYDTEIYCVFEKDNLILRRFCDKHTDFTLIRDKKDPFKAKFCGSFEQMKQQERLLIPAYFAIEVPLIHKNTYILHSSFVKINESAVIFSGNSGIGKSTQADLWSKHKNAQIINGDRSCLKVLENSVTAYGSVFAGSSKIYRNECAPVKAIIFLEQAETNSLQKLSFTEAFSLIYSQVLNNPWDKIYVQKLISAIEKTLTLIPVYKLKCRADKNAVDVVYDELFKR